MKIILQGIFCLILATSIDVQGQVVNKGELTILPGTLFATISNFNNIPEGSFINDGEFVVFSDFNNDGLMTFSADKNGSTNFQGTSRQIISGASPSELSKFKNVIFNNISEQPAFHLSSDISVSGTTDFLNGIVKINESAGAIVYENLATHINAKNESHVDGKVEKKGKLPFEFPTGKDLFLRSAKIIPVTENDQEERIYVGSYFLENSDLIYPHSSRVGNVLYINDKEYWEIRDFSLQKNDNQGKRPLIVSLAWDQSTTPDFIWQDLDSSKMNEEMITIVRWDGDKKLWVDEGGVVEIGPNGIGSGIVTSFARTSGDGIFTLARVKKRVEATGNIVVYNAVSPNGDGRNDYFIIDGIQKYPNNHVTIFNRWGVKVFETVSYDSNGNVFNGYSDGRTTVSSNDKLPSGTYFYTLDYEIKEGNNSKNIDKAGYLYLNDN